MSCHVMVYGDFKDLTRRTVSDKLLLDKASNIAKNPKYDGCQSCLAAILYKLFDKKSSGANTSGGIVTRANKSDVRSEIMSKQHPPDLALRQLPEELHKLIKI